MWNMITAAVLMLCSVDVRYLMERYILFLSVLETLHSECLSFFLRVSLFFAPPCHPLAWSLHYSNRCPRIPFSGVFFHFLLSSNPSFLLYMNRHMPPHIQYIYSDSVVGHTSLFFQTCCYIDQQYWLWAAVCIFTFSWCLYLLLVKSLRMSCMAVQISTCKRQQYRFIWIK